MKGLSICFSEVQVMNDVTDNNNKHFVTAFEGECRNIIELREHLKLCFLIIILSLVVVACAESDVLQLTFMATASLSSSIQADVLKTVSICLSVRLLSRLTKILHEMNIIICFKSVQ